MTLEEMLEMKLHDVAWLGAEGCTIRRVPGGWLYIEDGEAAQRDYDPVFVKLPHEDMQKAGVDF